MKKHKVYLSSVAEYKLELLIQYLSDEWGEQSKQNFLSELQSSVAKIESFPYSCPKSEKFEGIFKCVVSRLTSFHYRVYNEEIEILTITDNRQDPAQLLDEIRKLR